jgi:hypothetical protein
MASRVADQGRQAGEQMQEVAANFKGARDKSIKVQPMATLAGGLAAIGVIAALAEGFIGLRALERYQQKRRHRAPVPHHS